MRLLCCVVAVILLGAGGSAEARDLQTFRASAHANSASLHAVKRDSTIPESSGVALLGTSLLGFAGVIRKRFVD